MKAETKIVFGPVPSRRLGKSLGVNNIPYKVCSYACVYCQIGRTLSMSITRKEFYKPTEIYSAVSQRLREIEKEGITIDYITFVPDGEPTLDINLGKESIMLRETGYKTAIITNSSLIWDENVRKDLSNFDLVSLKIDAITTETWKKVNRPHKALSLQKILEGILNFAKEYKGTIITETMLIDGINYLKEAEKMSDFIAKIKPATAYITIPIRPPMERWVRPPREETVNMVYQIFYQKIEKVELLISSEGNDFFIGDDIINDIVSLTMVHPVPLEVLKDIIRRKNRDPGIIEDLIKKGIIKKVSYNNKEFLVKRFR